MGGEGGGGLGGGLRVGKDPGLLYARQPGCETRAVSTDESLSFSSQRRSLTDNAARFLPPTSYAALNEEKKKRGERRRQGHFSLTC